MSQTLAQPLSPTGTLLRKPVSGSRLIFVHDIPLVRRAVYYLRFVRKSPCLSILNQIARR